MTDKAKFTTLIPTVDLPFSKKEKKRNFERKTGRKDKHDKCYSISFFNPDFFCAGFLNFQILWKIPYNTFNICVLTVTA